MRWRSVARVLAVLVAALVARDASAQAELPAAGSLRVKFLAARQPEAYAGRVYVVLAKESRGEPRQQMGSWFGGPQVFAHEVTGVEPGGSVAVDAAWLGFPSSYADTPDGEYTVQAVARRSLDSPNPGRGDGDLYSTPQRVRWARGEPGVIDLLLTEEAHEPPLVETDRVKVVDLKSPCLSAFYGREVHNRAAVLLPKGWEDSQAKRYPTIYFISGFGGTHRDVRMVQRLIPTEHAGDALIVVPDPSCALGHSVFADSASNGPRGKALIEELIPEVEGRFHGAGDGSRRYVTGISSGGWSSLWLQVAYPDAFAGCWSHSPDPVDFRDFQRINLYAPGANMYRDEQGQRRPLARQGDRVVLWYDDFVRQETVMGPGGQIHSFEAVFSPRGRDGRPRPLFDRQSGAVDPETSRAWEKYDLRLVLERNWPALGPRLKGKIHVYAGGLDTFYLDGAAGLLKESLGALGSDAEVTIYPGRPHMIHPEGVSAMFAAIAGAVAASGPATPTAAQPEAKAELKPPPVITPGAYPGLQPPPSDAVVLFDGTSVEGWSMREGKPARWKPEGVKGGSMTVIPGSGDIVSKEMFGDAQIHVEFMTPVTSGQGQDRGNSGVYLQGRYEVQVLDSFKNETYPDGQCGAVYKQYVPLVNACRPPGEWQTYDIVFHAATFEGGKKAAPARVTVLHNGVLIQDNVELKGPTGGAIGETEAATGPLLLQEHGHEVKYRNIWYRPLGAQPAGSAR
jgi:S-formylglutathione hydrolase FrmB